MTSTAELTRHKLDQEFKGDRIKAMAIPGLEVASAAANPEATFLRSIPWYLPLNQRKWARQQSEGRANRLDWRNNKEHRELLSAKIRRSGERTEPGYKAKLELNAYREFELLQDLFAIPFAMGPFQAINLSSDELPLIVFPKARQYFGVRYIGLDGSARQDQWRDERSVEQHEMRVISTDKIEYPLWDVQQGNVNRQSDINAQLRFDMEMKLDELAQAQIDAAKTTSGLRDLLSLHPLIVAANIPDTNYLDLTGVDTINKLSLEKWKRILSHINSFGPGTDPDRTLTINAVIMSPQNVRDQWDYIDLVSGFSGGDEIEPAGTVLTSVREEIYRTGMLNSAWGYNWSSVPNNRLDKGRLYVFTNLPLGWFFTKTEMDQLLIWDGPDQLDENLGQIVWRRVFQFVVPDLWKHRVLIVDF